MSEVLLSARNVSKAYTMGKRSLEVLRACRSRWRGEFLAGRRVRVRAKHVAPSVRRTRFTQHG